jgi:hypothetical protein
MTLFWNTRPQYYNRSGLHKESADNTTSKAKYIKIWNVMFSRTLKATSKLQLTNRSVDQVLNRFVFQRTWNYVLDCWNMLYAKYWSWTETKRVCLLFCFLLINSGLLCGKESCCVLVFFYFCRLQYSLESIQSSILGHIWNRWIIEICACFSVELFWCSCVSDMHLIVYCQYRWHYEF